MGVIDDTNRAPPVLEHVRTETPYRGHIIVNEGPGDFEVYCQGWMITRCGTHWSCICYIDERLAP